MSKTGLKLILALLLSTTGLFAYQNSWFGLVSPTELGFLDAEISVHHRFNGAVHEDPLDNFFGMDSGANVALFYRQAFINGLEAKAGYIRANSEYVFDASWLFTKKEWPVQSQVNLEFFSYEDFMDPDDRHSNFLVLLAAQNTPFYDRFYFNANLAYNAEAKALGLGLGAAIKIINALTVLADYYPDMKNDKLEDDFQNSLRKKDTYSVGVKLDTYGHQFMFMLGNNEDMHMRQIMHGSVNNDIKFGFNIQRKLDF